MTTPREFPLCLMKIGEERKFMSMAEAGVAFDNGFVDVDTGGLVLNEDFTVRDMTREDLMQIRDIADAHSAGK